VGWALPCLGTGTSNRASSPDSQERVGSLALAALAFPFRAARRSQKLGAAFLSLAEGIDATTPAGKLQRHIVGAIAEFRGERVLAYLAKLEG